MTIDTKFKIYLKGEKFKISTLSFFKVYWRIWTTVITQLYWNWDLWISGLFTFNVIEWTINLTNTYLTARYDKKKNEYNIIVFFLRCTHCLAGYGTFTFKMDFYKNSSFATHFTKQDYPLSVALNEYVYLQYSVVSTADLVIMAENCKATKDASFYSWPQNTFLRNGLVDHCALIKNSLANIWASS